MSILTSCQDVRNNFVLKEIACPKCGNLIELFIRDGKTVGTAKCDICGVTISDGLQVSKISREIYAVR